MDLQERLSASSSLNDAPATADPFADVKNRIHMAVIGELGPQLYSDDIDEATLRERVKAAIGAHLSKEAGLSHTDRVTIAEAVTDDILGHGPLERLLLDDTVTEIMVNGPHDIWVERGGRLYQVPIHFTDSSHLRRIINKIVAQIGRRIDESSPMVDARLPDGSRVNAIIPPLSLSGPLRDDPQVRRDAPEPGRHDPDRNAVRDHGGLPQPLHPRRAEHPDLGRYRLRQDHAPECPVHRGARRPAHHHDRGRRRAEAEPAPRAAARVAPEQHRGRGRDRRSASWCGTRCACGPTGSSSARCAAPRRWTCSRR